jgi:hypothetical protein
VWNLIAIVALTLPLGLFMMTALEAPNPTR